MPTFQYSAADDQGNSVSGSVIGPNIQQAMATLSQRGLTVDKIEVARLMNDSLSSPAATGVVGGSGGGAPVGGVVGGGAPGVNVGGSGAAEGSGVVGVPGGQSPAAGSEVPGSAAGSTGKKWIQASSEDYSPGNRPKENLGVGASTTYEAGEAPGRYQGPVSNEARAPMGRNFIFTSILGPIVLKAPLAQFGFYLRQLSTMLKAGVPIIQATQTLHRQAKDPRMIGLTKAVESAVRGSRPISFGLQRYPETVSPVILAIIRVGEEGGFIDDAMAQGSDYIQREIELRNLYRRLTFYPKAIFAASFLIIAGANALISSLAPGAPGLSTPFALITWIFIAAVVIGIWLFLRIGLQNHQIKRGYDQAVLKIPVVGKTMHEMAMARFGRAFGALYKSGVPVGVAMRLAASACGNEALRDRMVPHFAALDHGAGMLQTFRATHAFSPIVLDMVATGETTGNVDDMLTKVAEYYEDEAGTKQMAVATVVGIICFLIVAVYIGFMIIHFYQGYFGGIMNYANSN